MPDQAEGSWEYIVQVRVGADAAWTSVDYMQPTLDKDKAFRECRKYEHLTLDAKNNGVIIRSVEEAQQAAERIATLEATEYRVAKRPFVEWQEAHEWE